MKSTVDALVEARSLIAKGWTKGEYVRNSKRGCFYCAVGAIREACGMDDNLFYNCLRALCKAVGIEELYEANLVGWNDSPQRKASDVVMAFDLAIESLNY